MIFATRFADASSNFPIKHRCSEPEIDDIISSLYQKRLYGVKLISRAENANGFINIYFSEEFYSALAKKIVSEYECKKMPDIIADERDYSLARSIMYSRKPLGRISSEMGRIILELLALNMGEGNEKMRKEAYSDIVGISAKNNQSGLFYSVTSRLL